MECGKEKLCGHKCKLLCHPSKKCPNICLDEIDMKCNCEYKTKKIRCGTLKE